MSKKRKSQSNTKNNRRNDKAKKKNSLGIIISCVIGAIVVIGLVLGAIFLIKNTQDDNTLGEWHNEQIDVNGLTIKEACTKLRKKGWSIGFVLGDNGKSSNCADDLHTVVVADYSDKEQDGLHNVYLYYSDTGINNDDQSTNATPNNYNWRQFLADYEKWANDYIDFIMPQVYYGFYNSTKEYYKVIKEWEELIKKDNIDLYIALAFYKVGRIDNYAKEGREEWVLNKNIIMREILLSRNLKYYQGFSLYRYDFIFNSNNFTNNSIEEIENMKKIL